MLGRLAALVLAVVVTAGLVLGVAAGLATPSVARAQASYGQYLVVIDDSGSMDQNDPRRLVVLASLALGAGLEDGDQIMIVGLGELASGEASGPAFQSPRELLAERAAAEGTRPVSGPRPERLGTHRGQTPCAPALERAQTILNAVASAGAPQTLLMLTDGACNGGAVQPAERWLSGVRAHREGRFRFVLLMKASRERADRHLSEYARATGWEGDNRVAFDARALLRGFANVLSFSRGLRYDDGGRVGLERTFAGARAVRTLAISDLGAERIGLERVEAAGAAAPLTGGPTFRHGTHEWSFRTATDGPRDTPYAVRSTTAGAEVLVIPVYGRLRVEAVVAPCGDAPPLPWTSERAVRAGQPACAWARLVGDAGETIVPGRSFDFSLDVCADPECASASAMQPSDDGTFNAQLGADFPLGRHERRFRASGGALAFPVVADRGFASMAFGIQRVALAETPDAPIERLDLGAIPKATGETTRLVFTGAFPADATADVTCAVEGDASVSACVVCEPVDREVALQDPFHVQLRLGATPFCEAVSHEGGQDLPVSMRVRVTPRTTAISPHEVPVHAVLRYAEASPLEVSLVGGSASEEQVSVPAPVAQAEVTIAVELDDEELEVTGHEASVRLRAGEDGRSLITLDLLSEDCCSPGVHEGQVVLTTAGAPPLTVPLRVTISDPGFWVCPGQMILRWALAISSLLFLIWVIRGFLSPAQFRDGALLLYASSHDALLELREGEDGYKRLERFGETKRGFRRDAALWLGGPRAPLPSFKRMPADGRIEARPGGGAVLIVTGAGVERFRDSTGWTELEAGEYPVSNNVLLRRGDEVYIQFRR